jgi:hypothetical protein
MALMGSSSSFTGEFSPNFHLKNMILTYTMDFSWKEKAQIRQILKKKIPNHQIFMISSSR